MPLKDYSRMSLGERLLHARESLGFSQTRLAKRSRVTQAAISRIERGETADPGVFVVAALAKALGIGIDALLQRAPMPASRRRTA